MSLPVCVLGDKYTSYLLPSMSINQIRRLLKSFFSVVVLNQTFLCGVEFIETSDKIYDIN
jgi:hypothetical protein